MARKTPKGTAKRLWGDAKKGALTRKGWPNVDRVISYVRSHPDKYSETMKQVALIANFSKHDEQKSKARAAMNRLKASRHEK